MCTDNAEVLDQFKLGVLILLWSNITEIIYVAFITLFYDWGHSEVIAVAAAAAVTSYRYSG